MNLELRGEHIALDALLKASGLASSGGEAKTLVQSGAVRVDGQVELRRGCKLRAGQVVTLGEQRIVLLAAGAPPT
jgi:ribosome-associated protein